MSEQDIKVSTLMLTYNHERFIGQAIEGVLMQKTDFPCELVIVEDCSTDRTRDVIREYWEKYPDRIRVLLNRHNTNSRRTVVRGYKACRGRYVAFLEGDDYWTCPDKLQRQAEILDRRPECSMCFHSVTLIRDDGRHDPMLSRPHKVQETYTLRDLVEYNFIPTCSSIYRKGVFEDFPSWHFLLPVGDWPMHILHARHGKIAYIDEPMGVYRQHAGGVHSLRPPEHTLRVDIKARLYLRYVLERKYRPIITRSLARHYAMLADVHRRAGRTDEVRTCVHDCVLDCCSNLLRGDLSLLKMLGRVYWPGPYERLWSLVHWRAGRA